MRFVTGAEVAGRLRDLPDPRRIVVSGNFATPRALLNLVDHSVDRYRVFVLNAQGDWPCRDGVVVETPFVGPGVRHDRTLDYLPMRLSLVPRLFHQMRPPDAVLVQTSVPRRGKVSLGIEVNILPAAIERVRARGGLVVAQVNPRMPYTLGDGEIDADDIDLGLEVDEALPSPEAPHPDDATSSIGERAARFVADGGTLQLGIGQVPDATASHLRGRRGLGVWSEMISDGVLGLERAGALATERPLRASFLFGSAELYDWVDRNPRLVMTRTEVVNDPARIAANPGMLSLNGALQVDLLAQANASWLGTGIFSGFGGQPDFVVGALHSVGGHAVVGLRSWHDGSAASTVVPMLDRPVTSLQHSAIVSEQGCAEIFGRSQRAQARLIIEHVAHPRARSRLWEAARGLGLGPVPSAGTPASAPGS